MSKRKKNVIENRRTPASKHKTSENSKQDKQQRELTTRQVKSPPAKSRHPSIASSAPQQTKKKKGKNGFKKFFRTFFILILLLVVAAFAVNTFFLENVTSDLQGNLSRYGISNEAAAFAKQHKIVNVAVFGVDGRDGVEGDRTDTIMIASADYEHRKVKVSSLMRDTYVYINTKYGYDKINAAYAYGGPDLAIQTINENFDTPITDYVTIDFSAMVTMVNAVGGVSIDIKSEDELEWVNEYLMDVNDKVNTGSLPLEDIGPQVVDGSQALAYCRVRYVGDGDFDRTLRQRVVFEQVLSKALDLKPMDQFKLVKATLPYVETSLTTLELIKYGINLALMPSKDIEQSRFPTDEYISLDTLDGVSYVVPSTLVDNIKALYKFVYETTYAPSDEATEISKEIKSKTVSSSSSSD
ncbi:LytR family transcriptional regulator [Acetobacterium fimetarium]|uniref:LytR family transcriptional regulator n=1 Tax=Acetobacterium fimetarium TaxID=52691 RepID=A0ABR6WZL4_9FIRM|nr:LCP family protein [Acetobacterium fimetarium]MBC3805621.1 LytR family transcriptional regulator [Acetobacterium fimetarium]